MSIFDLQDPLTFLLLGYSIVILSLLFIRKKNRTNPSSKQEISISVIIAYHNEEKNLPDLIKSIKSQTYDSSLIEYIFVNDRSSDKSEQLIKSLTSDFISNCTYLEILKSASDIGKKAALELGIKSAKSDYLLFTDADCIANSNWIESTALIYKNENADCIIGLAPLNRARNNMTGWFSEAETFFNHIIAYLSWSLNSPIMSFGRNFSYRKTVFNQISGFDQIKKSLSGDDDLLLEQLRMQNYKISFNTKSKVISFTESTLSSFIRQKTRHISAARFFSFTYQVIAGLFHLLNISLICWLLIDFSLQLLVTKLVVDLIFLWRYQLIFKFNSFFSVYIFWELFYWLYILFLGSKGYLTKIRLLKWN